MKTNKLNKRFRQKTIDYRDTQRCLQSKDSLKINESVEDISYK